MSKDENEKKKVLDRNEVINNIPTRLGDCDRTLIFIRFGKCFSQLFNWYNQEALANGRRFFYES